LYTDRQEAGVGEDGDGETACNYYKIGRGCGIADGYSFIYFEMSGEKMATMHESEIVSRPTTE
jgi:hypothetical protein